MSVVTRFLRLKYPPIIIKGLFCGQIFTSGILY